MPAAKKTAAHVAPAPALTADRMHEILLHDLDRQQAEAMAKAKREIARHIEQLQRALAMIDAGEIPYHSERYVDDRAMHEALTTAAATKAASDNMRGWLRQLNRT